MAFSDPVKILEQFGVHPGAHIADLGSGSGAYTLAAAHMAGAGGRVYSIDVQPDLVSKVKNTAHSLHLTNVEVIHGDMETAGGTRLADGICDAALVCNALFQVEQKGTFVDEIKRILKSTGRVLVVDWTDSFGGLGPQSEFVVTEDVARGLFEKHGFVFVSKLEAGDHHYGIIFRKA